MTGDEIEIFKCVVFQNIGNVKCQRKLKKVSSFSRNLTISKTYIFVGYNIPEITLREENNKMCLTY